MAESCVKNLSNKEVAPLATCLDERRVLMRGGRRRVRPSSVVVLYLYSAVYEMLFLNTFEFDS
jgi:hypothetical protein